MRFSAGLRHNRLILGTNSGTVRILFIFNAERLTRSCSGQALHEIYIVYARLRNARRIIVRIQLLGIAEFAISRSHSKLNSPEIYAADR